jgi:hypothetical protein
MGEDRIPETNKQEGIHKKEKVMDWTATFHTVIAVGCGLVLIPFLGYLLGKCIMFGILTAKQQFKEYENGKNKEEK